jgi:hypothetical protein
MVGVEHALWGPTYDLLPDLDPIKPALARKPLVVDPIVKSSGEGVYKTLNIALDEANPGDVILIKHNGLLALDLARLAKASTEVTIRPSPGFHPILTMEQPPEKDAALFTVHDGRLTLEGLEFRLQPRDDRTLALAVVKLIQDGACVFRHCVITLQEPGHASLAVVVLADPSGAMKMDKDKPESRPERGPGPIARVKFEDCFVRGEGDLVWIRASRPFDFECGNSLIALTGSLLNVEAGSGDAPTAAAGQTTNVKLSHLTAYLGGCLVRLKAGRESKSLIPIHCNGVSDCLFAAANKKTSLIHLDGPSSNEERMKALVQWGGGKNNAYSDFDSMLDQQPDDPTEMPDSPYGQKEWRAFTGENDGRFTRVKFADPPEIDKLAQTTPANFKVRDADPPLVGVEIKDLPRPGIGDERRPDSD